MLLSFHIENFKSIVDVTIPLSYAERKAPNGYKHMDLYPFLEEQEERTIPALVFYGANASGKSNIIEAFSLIPTIIQGKYQPSYFNPNKLHHTGSPMVLTLDFLASGSRFSYTLMLDRDEIVQEKLAFGNRSIFAIENRSTQFDGLVSDAYSVEKLQSIFSVECLDQDKRFRDPFVSVVGRNYAGLDHLVTAAYVFMTRSLEVYRANRFPFTLGMSRLSETHEDVDMQKAFKEIVSILRKLDIDITRMEFKRHDVGVDRAMHMNDSYAYDHHIPADSMIETEINSYHKDIHGKEVRFDFHEESLGTQRVACLIGVVLSVIRRGHVLIIDELGNSLHPYLLAEIVRLFKDKRYNTTNAQLIFTTHNTDIMDQDMMRVSEIGIVKKTLKKGTKFTRISDFEGVRNVTSFRKQYLEGAFSGIPYPYI